MRQQTIFTGHDGVSELFNQFRTSQGALFHYTSIKSIDSIKSGSELWVTRADSFLDKEEIKYGLNVFRSVSEEITTDKDKEFINKYLLNIEEYLQSTYVLSLTSISSDKYLLDNYGAYVIELCENFPTLLGCTAWHSIPSGDCYTNHYFIDHYEKVEGYVIYDYSKQIEISNMVISTILNMLKKDTHVIDVYHMRKIFIMCMTLFKHSKYRKENEYRVSIIRNTKNPSQDFNEKRNNSKKHYIKAIIPGLHQKCIVNINNIR